MMFLPRRLMARKCSSNPHSERYVPKSTPLLRTRSIATLARRIFSFGTTTTARGTTMMTPSHLAQEPRVRFSGMAMIR